MIFYSYKLFYKLITFCVRLTKLFFRQGLSRVFADLYKNTAYCDIEIQKID